MAGLLMPVPNAAITSPYGARYGVNPLQASDFHTGIDLGVPVGTAVYATHSGYFRTEQNYGGGTMIRGQGGSGWSTVYAHLSRSVVGTGKYVEAGQIIGYSGMSGAAVTGPHLHYEVLYNGQHVDPRYASPVNGNIGQAFVYDADTAARQQAQQLSDLKRAQAEQQKFEVDRSRGILGEFAAIAKSQQSSTTGKRPSRFGIQGSAARPTRAPQSRTGQTGRKPRFAEAV
jgi:murein DD-endopeptidase MepM/ murein hydrolase activator NlpD